MRKYLNYIIFGAVVLLVVGLAVSHSRHMRMLVDELAGNDAQAHVSAANELIKDEQFGDAISGELPETRVKVARALQDVPTTDGVKQTLNLLKDQDKTVRAQALETLKKIGAHSQETIDALVVGLKDGDVNVRKGTIAALTDPADKGGIGPLPNVTQAVLAIIKKEGDARGPGGNVLSSSRFLEAGVRAVSVPALIGYLGDKDNGVRSGAADALGKIGDESAVQPLITLLNAPDTTPDLKRVATGAIALIAAPSCEPSLTDAVTNVAADNDARAQAALGLGKIATPSAISTLVRALNDDDLKLRSAVVVALAQAGQANNPRARQTALTGLTGALQDANVSVRLGAAQTLQSLHAPEANAALTQALQGNKDAPDVRAEAAAALGFANNQAAVAPLIAALSDPDGNVATAAQQSLTTIGPPAVPELMTVLQRGGTDALYAAQALGRQGTPALSALQQAAGTAPPLAQRWIAVALGTVGTAEARPALQQLAQSPDNDVKFVAQQQLNRLTQ